MYPRSNKPGSNKNLDEKENFRLLLEAGQIINSTLNIDEVLNLVMDKVIELMGAERGFIMLIDDRQDTKADNGGEDAGRPEGDYFTVPLNNKETLKLRTARGVDKKTIDSEDFSVSLSSIKSIARGEEPHIFSPNTLLDPKLSRRASINLHSIRYVVCFPIKFKEKITGVIYVDNRIATGGVYDENQYRDLLEGLANQAAIAIENAKLHEKIQKSYLDVIRALANAIEAKNPYTRGHSDRVTRLAVETGKAMKLSSEQLKEIEMAGILHDVGKIGVEEAVLNKPGRLTSEEFEKMMEHPRKGSEILETIDLPQTVKDAVLHHQEKYDGTGYPDCLKEDTIPLYARIIAVCDSYDAMTSDRVYRKGLGKEYAITELNKYSGTQFDPLVVNAFLEHKIYNLD